MYYGAACAHCQRVAQENRSPRLAAAHFAVFVAVFIAAEILFRFVGFSLPSGCAPRGGVLAKWEERKGRGGGRGSTHDYIVKVLYVIIAAVGGCATCAPSLSLSLCLFLYLSLSPHSLSLLLPVCAVIVVAALPLSALLPSLLCLRRVCCCGLLKTFCPLPHSPSHLSRILATLHLLVFIFIVNVNYDNSPSSCHMPPFHPSPAASTATSSRWGIIKLVCSMWLLCELREEQGRGGKRVERRGERKV